MSTLLLLRHGPTGAGRRGAPLGRLDLPVDPEGQASWPQVRAELLALGPEEVLCSPLARSRAHALDLGLPCRILPGLAEQDFGAWDGRPWAELEGTQAFFADPVDTAPPAGESFRACARRALAALEAALADQPALEAALADRPALEAAQADRPALEAALADRPILVLAHAGPLRAILAGFLGLPLERALDLAWDPFGLTRLERLPGNRCWLRWHNLRLPSGGPSGIL